jgi:cbb3-type cytochrome c oxidase subunit III
MNNADFVFTSEFWNWWVIALTLGNILACWWLIAWTSKKKTGESASGAVTGHTWDENLQEYNNPLPRWWLWLFHITLVFGLIYLALYPGLGKFAASGAGPRRISTIARCSARPNSTTRSSRRMRNRTS